MPIIKSAKKRVTQSLKRQVRNYNTRTALRKAIRRVTEAVKAGDKSLAETELAAAYKVIDTAAKKNVLQKNTAARRKSGLAKSISAIKAPEAGEKKAPAAKKSDAPKKTGAPKKAAAKAAPKKKAAASKAKAK